MKIARVFPRKTGASPDDNLAFFGPPPMLVLPEIDAVNVSVAFTYDMELADELAYQWEALGVPVKIGGPALNEPGGDFVPGMYLKQGYVITSRGCPNRCWFCSVPRREGYTLRELPITEGWNVLDDNLLACGEQHIRGVFEMLGRQPQRPVFTGGLEAKLLQAWHVDLLKDVKTKRLYFAYDTPDDLEPLTEAGKLLRAGGFTQASHSAGCYVLVGYSGDTLAAAEKRLVETIQAGFVPYAMLYKDKKGETDKEWRKFQTEWVNRCTVGAKIAEIERMKNNGN